VFLKMLMPVLMLVITLFTTFWGRHWQEEKRKIKRGGFILFAFALTFVSMWIIYNDSQENSRLQESNGKLLNKVSELETLLRAESQTAENRDRGAKEDRVRLQNEFTAIKLRLEPFVQIAKARYPGVDADLALKKLAQEVDLLKNKTERIETRTEELASREVYRPLVSLLKGKVVADFKMIKEKYNERNLHVKLNFEIGNRNRQFISRDLAELFRLSEIKAEEPASVSTFPSGGGVLPPAEMRFHPEDVDLAEDLAKSINGFVNVRFQGKKDNKLERGTVLICFYGNPLFSKDGSVILN
jgi:hypothetical protein